MYIIIIMVLKVGWFWVAGTNLHGDVKTGLDLVLLTN